MEPIELSKDEALSLIRAIFTERSAAADRADCVQRLYLKYGLDPNKYKLDADNGRFVVPDTKPEPAPVVLG